MFSYRVLVGVLVGALLLALPACGGGGQGLRIADDSIRVASASLPAMVSGEYMEQVIPLEGGCGGPYVPQLIEGSLPDGLEVCNDKAQDGSYVVCLRGYILEDGEFDFTLQITDSGCEPFKSTTQAFHLSVGVGEMQVVEALLDGNPSLIRPGDEAYDPVVYPGGYPALSPVVYNDLVTIELVVAGGTGPYAATVYDDPQIPDGQLPLGASIPPLSTSITGAPVEVGPGGGPFLVTVQIEDSVGGIAYFTFYWLVDTPAIIKATEDLLDGQAGTVYSDTFLVAEGVPPFVHEFVEVGLPVGYTSDKSTNPELDPATDVIYNPGTPPTVTPPEALNKIDASVYPGPTEPGPDYSVAFQGAPSEGMRLFENSGSLSGIPRRRGTFSVNWHVRSALVPNSFGQHAWATFEYDIAGAPAIVQDPSYTLEGVFTVTPPYARIEEAQQGLIYNPDGGPAGLQLWAVGGVPQDGRTDAPHESQTSVDPSEVEGAHTWSVNWDPDSEGNAAIPYMELTPDGIFRIEDGHEDDLVPQFEQALGFTAYDWALPTSAVTSTTEKVRFGIGPDKVIITQSTTSFTPSSYDNRRMNDTAMTLKLLIPNPAGDTIRSPNDSDLPGNGAGKIGLPSEAGSGTSLSTLLTNMDLLRVSVNPTTYYDDVNHLNPNAARPFQDGDRNACYAYYGVATWGTTSYSPSSSYSYQYQNQPTGTCVRLPVCSSASVSQNLPNGVYKTGGKLYVFDTSAYFGIFIIRKDGRIYVPAAFEKSTSGYRSFGDNWTQGYVSAGSANSVNKIPQMTISPDGRFAAFKLRTSTSYYQYETANTTPVLLVSLTGERVPAWGNSVYKIVSTGSGGSSSTGQYMFASSLTLTNGYLYYLLGSGSTNYMHFKDHYIYRYDLFGGASAGAFLHPNFNSEWTNTTGSAMQTPFQCWYRSFSYYSGPDVVMVGTHGHNSYESSMAPHPFRVNTQGNACAILAGRTTSNTYTGSDIRWHHVWIDYEGTFHQLSTQRRHTSGGGRMVSLSGGPTDYPVAYLWGTYNGPTTRFEISDDGLKVAVVYFRDTTVYGYKYYSSPSYSYKYREDISAYVSTGATPWSGVSLREITGDTSTSTSPSGKFSSSSNIVWRFGALTFTKEGDGLVFWGGYSNEAPTNTYMYYYYAENGAKSFVGSFYSYDFSDQSVRNILSSTYGGCNKTVGSAQSSINFSTSAWQVDGGVIKPIGGFRSMNGDFLYVITRGGISSSDKRDAQVIGVNVRSLDTSQSINSRTDGRAFLCDGRGSTNGFYPTQYYLAAMGFAQYSYSSLYHQYYLQVGDTQAAASTDNGWVFFTSVQPPSSSYYSNYQSYTYGGCVNYTHYAYPYYPKKVYVFDPNTGGNATEVLGSGWTGSSYQVVGGLVPSDDGSCLLAVDSTATYYNWTDRERLTLVSGIDLSPTTGAQQGSLTRETFESSRYVSSHFTFSPQMDAIFYAAGTGNENAKTLKRGVVDSGATKTSYGFTNRNYNVLHAGR